MTNHQATEKRLLWWLMLAINLLGFFANAIEGPKKAFDWVALLAMLGCAIMSGLLLSGRMGPK